MSKYPTITLVLVSALSMLTGCGDSSVAQAPNSSTVASTSSERTVRTKAVFAAKNIAVGTKIKSTDVEVREVPIAEAPPESLKSSTVAVGQYAAHDISAGTVLSYHDFSAPVADEN